MDLMMAEYLAVMMESSTELEMAEGSVDRLVLTMAIDLDLTMAEYLDLMKESSRDLGMDIY